MPRIVDSRRAYDGYAKITVLTLADDDGEPYLREVVSIGQSACVLPYDPERKVALVVRLPRAPLLMQGIATNLIEAPAGMIGDGEAAEATIRLLAFAGRLCRAHASLPRALSRRRPCRAWRWIGGGTRRDRR